MAHYPPYCSKYNPIEHRLFPHLTPGLPGGDLRQRGDGQAIDGEDEDEHGVGRRGRDPGEGVPDGAEVCRGLQEEDEDRVRRVSSPSGTTGPSRRPHETGNLLKRRS